MALTICLSVACAPAAGAAGLRTDARCYRVGQPVQVTGSGFAASAVFDVAVDGIDFGQSTTTAAGTFATSLLPGGLPAGTLQATDRLDASDGTTDAAATFTLTRPTGARFVHGRFQVWDFAPNGEAATIYLHYVRRRTTRTVELGRTTGPCGTLQTPPRRLFGFRAAAGAWTLQFDTHRSFSPVASGPRASLTVVA
jgi:hypothetical protein